MMTRLAKAPSFVTTLKLDISVSHKVRSMRIQCDQMEFTL